MRRADAGADSARTGGDGAPLAREQSTTPETAGHGAGGAEPEPRRQVILIAEDEEHIADALAMIIEDAGYPAPLIASQGQEAYLLARAHRPALVITDLMMPLMDGAELVRALRADARADGYALRIVLMTAAGMRRASGVEADALLRKPFSLTEVEELLRRFLGPPQGRQEAE